MTTTINFALAFQPGAAFFINGQEGWVACSHLYSCDLPAAGSQPASWALYKTLDSGARWSKIAGLDFANVISTRPTFIDSTHGFLSTISNDGVGRMFVTQDGGSSWRPVVLPAPQGGWRTHAPTSNPSCSDSACTLPPIMFGRDGVLQVLSLGAYYTYTTHDGGVTWGSVEPVPFMVSDSVYYAVAPLDASRRWGVDSSAELQRTDDAGIHWQPVPTVMPRGYQLVSVTPAGTTLWGLASKDSGKATTVVQSLDGGASWTLAHVPT